MRWLKGLVVGMAVMIVIAATVVVVELVRRSSSAPEPAAAGAGRPAPPVAGIDLPGGAAAPRTFGETRIELPPGAVVEETTAGDGRLIVRLGLPDGDSALLLIDADSGRRLGLVRLAPAP